MNTYLTRSNVRRPKNGLPPTCSSVCIRQGGKELVSARKLDGKSFSTSFSTHLIGRAACLTIIISLIVVGGDVVDGEGPFERRLTANFESLVRCYHLLVETNQFNVVCELFLVLLLALFADSGVAGSAQLEPDELSSYETSKVFKSVDCG